MLEIHKELEGGRHVWLTSERFLTYRTRRGSVSQRGNAYTSSVHNHKNQKSRANKLLPLIFRHRLWNSGLVHSTHCGRQGCLQHGICFLGGEWLTLITKKNILDVFTQFGNFKKRSWSFFWRHFFLLSTVKISGNHISTGNILIRN